MPVVFKTNASFIISSKINSIYVPICIPYINPPKYKQVLLNLLWDIENVTVREAVYMYKMIAVWKMIQESTHYLSPHPLTHDINTCVSSYLFINSFNPSQKTLHIVLHKCTILMNLWTSLKIIV